MRGRDEVGIIKQKALRGDIVRRLYGLFGTPVVADSLRHTLRHHGYCSDDDVRRAILYLNDDTKQYLHFSPREADGVSYNFWNTAIGLTGRGVNLAEGDISDDGVILDE